MKMTKENTKVYMTKEGNKFVKKPRGTKKNLELVETKKEFKQDPREKYDIKHRSELDRETAMVKFKKLDDDVQLPERQTLGSAGYDIFANEKVTIEPNHLEMIPTGFQTAFKPDYVALIYSRSGIATKKGLIVCQGTAVIDSDYRGEWFVPIYNRSNETQVIDKGERIAQFILQPTIRIRAVEVNYIGLSERGEGGFGSTGE